MSDDVARMIIAAAQKLNLTPEQTIACLATAIQESNLDPSAIGGGGAWVGVYQQDTGYPNRGTAQGNVDGFFSRLATKLTSPGVSPDIWKNIFWLQQDPGYASADIAYANGRQAYLTEIKSRTGQATDLYNRLAATPAPTPTVQPGIPQANFDYLWNTVVYPRVGKAPYDWGGSFSPTNVWQGTDCSGGVSTALSALVRGAGCVYPRQFFTGTFAGAQPGDTGPWGGVSDTTDLVCIAHPGDAPPDAAMIIAIRQMADPADSHMICQVQGITVEMGGNEFLPNGVESDYHTNPPDTNCSSIFDTDEFNQWLYLPGGEEDTMAGVNIDGLNLLIDKFLATPAATGGTSGWPSRSMFADANKPVDDGMGMLLNADGNAWNTEMILGVLLGVPYSVAQVQRMATGQFPADTHVATDPWLRQIATDFAVKLLPLRGSLANLGSSVTPVPIPAPDPVPAPAPIPAPPVPDPAPAPVGTNSFGPAGLIGILGLFVSAAIQMLPQLVTMLPQQWANIATGIIGVLTILGIYKAPNHKVDSLTPRPGPTLSNPPPPSVPPPPASAPPAALPVSPAVPPSEMTLSDSLAHAASEAAAQALADAEPKLEEREIEAVRQQIRKTLGA